MGRFAGPSDVHDVARPVYTPRVRYRDNGLSSRARIVTVHWRSTVLGDLVRTEIDRVVPPTHRLRPVFTLDGGCRVVDGVSFHQPCRGYPTEYNLCPMWGNSRENGSRVNRLSRDRTCSLRVRSDQRAGCQEQGVEDGWPCPRPVGVRGNSSGHDRRRSVRVSPLPSRTSYTPDEGRVRALSTDAINYRRSTPSRGRGALRFRVCTRETGEDSGM